jgi:hypothetical protein
VYLSEAAQFDVRGDRSAIDECFTNIRTCDYYILLIGSMRGNLFAEGTSITRQEYRVARDQFLSLGRPRLFLYLREASESALRGNQEVQTATGIDDPDHLASFIDEVQRPQIEGTPNYLTRFRDFEDLIHSLANRLNLGRNLSEKLTRHSLVSELLLNLSLMVNRTGNDAFPHHRYMRKVREEVSITPKELEQHIVLSDDHVVSLVFALVGRTRGKDLCTKAIEESLDRGVFLTFNLASGALEESPMHQALRQLFTDIQALCQLDAPTADPEWHSQILRHIKTVWRGRPYSLEMVGYDLAFALAHYNRAENVFNGHVALCKVLLGLSAELQQYQRQPITPLGELEEERLRAENLSAAEIALLIQNDIWPFGNRIPRELYGATHEERVKRITQSMHTTLTKAGIDASLYPPDILKGIAEKFLEEHTVSPRKDLRVRSLSKLSLSYLCLIKYSNKKDWGSSCAYQNLKSR